MATCSVCGLPPTIVCSGCRDGVGKYGSPSPTWYCGQACQINGWSSGHQEQCKAANHRKQLYRAGAILKNIFYGIREGVSDRIITHAADSAGLLILSEDTKGPHCVMARFPSLQEVDRREREMAMVYQSSGLALASMYTLVYDALKGTATELYEALVIIASVHEFVKMQGQSVQPRNGHYLLKVHLPDGCVYALDICGSAYGQDQVVVPWSAYEARFDISASDQTLWPHGHLKAVYTNVTPNHPCVVHTSRCTQFIIAELGVILTFAQKVSPSQTIIACAVEQSELEYGTCSGKLCSIIRDHFITYADLGPGDPHDPPYRRKLLAALTRSGMNICSQYGATREQWELYCQEIGAV